MVMADPFAFDAVHDTWSDWLPRTTATAVGAVGGPIGITAGEGSEGADWLMAFKAITVKV